MRDADLLLATENNFSFCRHLSIEKTCETESKAPPTFPHEIIDIEWYSERFQGLSSRAVIYSHWLTWKFLPYIVFKRRWKKRGIVGIEIALTT